MHKLFRSLAATAILATLLLGAGASTVLAGSSAATPATPERYDFDADWCFDEGARIFCTTMQATLFVVATPDGREQATIHVREDVVITDHDGNRLGGYSTKSIDRTVFADGGQDSTFSVTHTKADGLGYRCESTAILRIVDYELKLDKLVGPLCR